MIKKQTKQNKTKQNYNPNRPQAKLMWACQGNGEAQQAS